MAKFDLAAPCLFGTESIAAEEFKRMGFHSVSAENGRVLLSGEPHMLARANLCSRYAERIFIRVGAFSARSFTELFDGVRALPWEEYIGRQDAFPVNGWSLQSALHSVPDCQSIVKKAIVERLSEKYGIAWFEETGTELKIRFSIHKDQVTMMIDTSGEGLHKRGYRRSANDAPLKETLAASMCDLLRIYPDTRLFDPMCGSGTILIEAALMATGTAPGLRRFFAAERFSFLDRNIWQQERARARDLIRHDVDFRAVGFDLDPNAVELTLHNAKKAGVERYVKASVAPLSALVLPQERCTLITNPPYGERLLDLKKAEEIYNTLGKVCQSGKGKKYGVISPHDEFESFFGRRADKRRKLYNGMIKCQYYMYYRG